MFCTLTRRNVLCVLSSNIRTFSKERAGKSVKIGAVLVIDGAPHKVIKSNMGKRGKGGGFVRATLKNILNSSSFEKTFTSDETVEHADLEFKKATYSWNDGTMYNFMDAETFDEIQLHQSEIDNKTFLLEGMEVKLNIFRGDVISVELPQSGLYTILAKGRQIDDEYMASLEGGAEVMVPANIAVGTRVKRT